MATFVNYATCNDPTIEPIARHFDGQQINDVRMAEVVMLCDQRADEIGYSFEVVLGKFIRFIRQSTEA